MTPIKVFISSKVNPIFEHLDDSNYSLGDLRNFIKTKLETEEFLGTKLVKAILNEEGFEATFDRDAFDSCLDVVHNSDIVVILFTGDAGWAPLNDVNANGICHEEYLIAVRDHPSMTFGINISGYFQNNKFTSIQKERNLNFKKDVESLYRFKEYSTGSTVKDLQDYTLKLIKGYIKKSIELAFTAKKELDAVNTIFGLTLDWRKLTYEERIQEIKKLSIQAYKDIFEKVICLYHAIPDHMSVSDARNRMGRPFLYEHNMIKGNTEKKGVIHFISVYGNATEGQLKELVGFPDLTLINTSFGFYLWEQTTQIQFIVALKCINPNVIKTRKQQIINWINSSQEKKNINIRAESRYNILQAIINAQKKTK